MTERGSHRVGRPLGAEDAQARAAQAAVLGDLLALRVLSAVAANAPLAHIPALLHIAAGDMQDALNRLQTVGIVRKEAGEYLLPAESWVRFGRLLGDGVPALPNTRPAQPALAALPTQIATVARDLSYRFASTFSEETVSQYVVESYLLLSQRARVRTHLPTLTARYAADRLDALASATGLTLRGTPEVLFVCVQNAGRSQIAAAYLRHLAGDAVHVRTAGSAPADEVHPRVIEALAEVGVPLVDDFPKPLTDEVVQAADFVVTMGCGDACPVYPGRRYMDWSLEDPLALDDDGLRQVRDRIRGHVERLLNEMGVGAHAANR
ncbi:arsenate reductase ArsC [Microbacterium thalli]|uniref:Arsenate reductase ArsC n=1 Tax=Microbacterium thalli TaxID=3027921 RepID=A0ABT5SL48_9MICO|nr:arsenate reductase ArsC [Microbacterium thalli]MDD7929899.1 arsenate reductase ArsC [Microbacterium thalli]MDD7963564.1 arsenate reductase ArsC [Microbacterium thalli]MDN8549564.1 arsenate reductase ArsC [Microbacterium thalli]